MASESEWTELVVARVVQSVSGCVVVEVAYRGCVRNCAVAVSGSLAIALRLTVNRAKHAATLTLAVDLIVGSYLHADDSRSFWHG